VWPPRSPDLSPLNFFFGGYIKESVYTPSPSMPQNLHELKIHILGACESVDMQILSTVWNEINILTCAESPMGFTLRSDK